ERDAELTNELLDLLKKDGFYNSADAAQMAKWNPYSQTEPAGFFDAWWMFGIENGFDVVIGNPPYVESRSADVPQELKEKYLEQVSIDFGKLSQYITKGSDLLIYFFSRSIFLLRENGCGSLIVQNGWLNTDYGAKVSNFFVNTLDYIKVSDSPFRHFDKNSANINTVITLFKKKSVVKSVCFDMMRKQGDTLLSGSLKSFAINDNILTNVKWGVVLYTTNDIFSIYQDIISKGSKIDQSFYSIGQGINENQDVFIPVKEKSKIEQQENIIYAVFKEYKYHYKTFDYFLYHQTKKSSRDINLLRQINAQEFAKRKNIKRKYPAIILPRGIGATHFAGIIDGKAFSNSYVDIYMIDDNEEMKMNIWLFCNSSLFFLYREISGRKNLGGGLLKSEATDIKSIPLYFPISDKKTLLSIIENAGNPISLPERLQTPVQRQIDSLVFSYFNIEKYEKLIIRELNHLFNFRNQKAKHDR
ncbi:MAG: Eco57I restriction-modification methylase domain-containing protein, partial [Bacteroidales bacterium]|nr:Eco57I restriction-modification methylase domain-containing protein [Bacteroidales bacterium]